MNLPKRGAVGLMNVPPGVAMTADERLSSILTSALQAIPGTRDAILLSHEGLPIAYSEGLPQQAAEYGAAVISTTAGIVRGVARFWSQPDPVWRETIIDFDRGRAIVVAVGPHAFLVVFTASSVNVDLVLARLHDLAQRLGSEVTTDVRHRAVLPWT